MALGISTACFYPFIETENSLDIISELDFKTFEVFLETNYEYTEEYAYKLRQKADKLGLKINSIHAFPVTFEPYLFDSYPRRRNDSFNIYREVIKAARILGAECYTFHGNRSFPGEKNYGNIAKVMDEAAEIAKSEGVFLAWENVAWCESNDPEFIARVMDKTSSDNIRFTLDFKQALKSGNSLESYIEVMGEKLVNIHLNDADGDNPCLLPGRGNVDFDRIFRLLFSKGYNGNFIIEVYRDNFKEYSEIESCKMYIQNILNNLTRR